MSSSLSVATDSTTTEHSKPAILSNLPDIAIAKGKCSPRIQQHIDLLLLGIEALHLAGAERMLTISHSLKLQEIIKNRIIFWRLRCTNPWRRSYTRNSLTLDEAKALILVAGLMARQLNVTIRQLVLAEQQMREKRLPFDNHYRLSEYLERFRAHFRSRMNSKRTKVAIYLESEDTLNDLALSVLNQLLLFSGTRGVERLWISLFDGEVDEHSTKI